MSFVNKRRNNVLVKMLIWVGGYVEQNNQVRRKDFVEILFFGATGFTIKFHEGLEAYFMKVRGLELLKML